MAGLDDVVFDQDGVPVTSSGRLYVAPARNAGDAEGVVNGNDSAAPDLIPTNNNRLTQALAPQPTLLDRIAALKDALLGPVGQFMDYDQQFTRNVLGLPQTMRNNPEATRQVMRSITGMDERHTSPGKTGRPAVTPDGTDRQQTWPERMVREGATAPGDVSKPNPYPPGSEEWDWYEDQRSNAMVPAALAVAALAGGGALTERPGVATLGSGPVRLNMPRESLTPAIKINGRVIKGKGVDDSHEFIMEDHNIPLDPKTLDPPPGVQTGFVDHRGRFLNHEQAADYASIAPHLVHPEHVEGLKDGILTSEMLRSDSSQPAAAVAALKPAPVFYSALEHAATNAAQDTMAPQQWLGYLKNQPGVKKEELDWSGLEGWLGAQKGKVNKQDVQSYLDAHRTEIKDVTKGEPDFQAARDQFIEDRGREPHNDQELREYAHEANEYLDSNEFGGTKYSSYQLPGGENYREHLLTLPNKTKEQLEARYQQVAKQSEKLEAKLIKQFKKDNGIGSGPITVQQNYMLSNFLKTHHELSALNAEAMSLAKQTHVDTMGYRSSHWDEPNVLAHVRTNDRTFSDSNIKGPPGWTAKKSEGALDRALAGQPGDGGGPSYNVYDANGKYQGFASAGSPDEAVVKLIQDDSSVARRAGFLKDNSPAEIERWQNYKGHEGELKKSLHIEEIQSDWHQQGRKSGYKDKPLGPLTAEVRSLGKDWPHPPNHPMWEVKGSNGDVRTIAAPDAEAAKTKFMEMHETRQYANAGKDLRVPDAPFKSSWPELALKRMIRHAAENGYDRISWTPGKAQAARYDLSKQLKQLTYQKNKDGTFNLHGQLQNGGSHDFGTKIPIEKLPDYVGKEIADRIANPVYKIEDAKLDKVGYTFEKDGRKLNATYKTQTDAQKALEEMYDTKAARDQIKIVPEDRPDYLARLPVDKDFERVKFQIVDGSGKLKALAENKEQAEKLVESFKGGATLRDVDLKVGGEGMREFYDKMLPKMVEKIGKAYGVKVKQTSLGERPRIEEASEASGGGYNVHSPNGNTDFFETKAQAEAFIKRDFPLVHYFDLPQSLKDAALHKGFPLYMTGVPFPLIPVEHDPFQKDK